MIARVDLGAGVDLKARVSLGSKLRKLALRESKIAEPNILAKSLLFTIILLPYTIASLRAKSLSSSLIIV